MSEPRTPTGHQLVARKRRSLRDPERWGEAGYQEGEVLAIEAEAAALERRRLMSLLSLSDGDPDHAPGPGYLSDRRALFLSGWHERAQAFRAVVDFADMPMSTAPTDPADEPTDA